MPRPSKRADNKKEILDYRFRNVKRKNNPEEGLTAYLPEEHETKTYQFDPHLDPQLVWSGKQEHPSFEVPILSLHIHERITTRSILSALEKNRPHQLRLFDEAEFPLDKRIEFYKHDTDWANRLVLGDSLLVMNSLLLKEGMEGKVQTVYVDPPYGIAYNSNFQPSIREMEVKDRQDDSLTREPEMIRAYRDTWELGIHSYLAYLRDRFLLVRLLLTESGSVFVQINDENIHHVKEILDEIFGPSNFCSIICLQKTGGLGSKLLSGTFDYILWYAKDKKRVKYHQLFLEKELGGEGASKYEYLELQDGSRRRLSAAEKSNPDILPKSSRPFRLDNLTSQGNALVDFRFEGKVYRGRWKTSSDGMEKLAAAKRIVSSENSLNYVRYLDDFDEYPLTNYWPLGGIQSRSDPKVYVVQTATSAIQNCILMSSDPGELVFDPTCGSGSTAYVAEKWGRRWITCDTSRVAIAIAKRRLMTAVHPYFELAHPEEGLQSGFKLKQVPHTLLSTFTSNEPVKYETLYDKPVVDDSAIRVAGPFTCEAIPAPSIEATDSSKQTDSATGEEYLAALIDALRKSGIVFPRGKVLRLQNIVSASYTGFIHAEALAINGTPKKVAISFGPRYGPLSARQAEEAIRTATMNGFDILVLAAFSFDPGAQSLVQKTQTKIEVHFSHINPDMELHDLLKNSQGSQLFSVFGEPDLLVEHKKASDDFVVKLRGVDIYDPVKSETFQTSGEDLPAWFLDEDYDGFSFNICQAFFPGDATNKSPWDKLENALHGIVDKDKMEMLRGTASIAFKLGGNKTIAVKVIDNRGNEVVKILKLSQGKA